MLRKGLVFLLLNVSLLAYGQRHDLSRVCVVDIQRVYQALNRESAAERALQERTTRVQEEINRRQAAILELRGRHSEAVLNNDQNEANRLLNQIQTQTTALNDYHQRETAQINNERQRQMQAGSFRDDVQNAIRQVAESDGYSIVFDRSSNSGILWYSGIIDITDKVITNLNRRR